MTKRNLGSLAALALIAAACADPATGPNRALLPSDVSAAITNEGYFFPPGFPGIAPGEVQVCKAVTNMPAGLPAAERTFTFAVTSPDGAANPQIVVPDDGATTCITVFTSTLNLDAGAEQVVVTEGADPTADWDLSAINTIRFLAQGILNENGYDDEDGFPGGPDCLTNNCLDDVESFGTRTATLFINDDMARRVTFTNNYTAPPPPPGLFGCTPGYWKQSHHFGNWIGYTGGQSYYDVFGVSAQGGLPNTLTLLGALQMGGGGIKAMVRHSVASLLNAAQGFAPYSEAQIIAFVQNAFATENYSTAHSLFEDYNETGCPLGRAPLTKN